MSGLISVYHPMNGVLRRLGRADIRHPSTGNQMVYGVDRPGPSNTGHYTPLTDLGNPATDLATLPNVPVIEGRRIYGDIKWRGDNDIVLRNCLLVGGANIPSSAAGVVDCNAGHQGRIILEDCTIQPREPRNRDCIVGHRWEAYRCNLSGSIDGMGIFVTEANGTSADVKAMGNWVHDLTYVYPDYRNGVNGATWHTDGTHNDGAQLQGGNNVHLKGNFFDLMNSNPATTNEGPNPEKAWMTTLQHTNGSCVIVQSNTGMPIDDTVIVEQNWFRGGLSQLNVKPGMKLVFRNNKHYVDVARNTSGLPGTWSGYWIRLDRRAGTEVAGLTTTNRWVDGPRAGALMAEPREAGIHFNE